MAIPELVVTSESVGTRVVQLTIEIPDERVQKEMQRTARRITRQVNIPGFRKGKAPYSVIVQRYGEETILQETAEALVEEVYRQAVEDEGLTLYAPGSLVDMELAPMRFVFTVPLAPVVELGDYRSLRIKPSTVRVKKKEVAEVLEQLREEHAILEPAEGRGAQPGDMLVIDVEGHSKEGALLLDDKEVEVVLDPEREYPTPGFFKALEGMVPDEVRTFTLKMPEGSPTTEAEFEVRLTGLSDRILPGLDDDLARTVGNFDSLKALEKDIKEQIRQRKQQETDDEYAEKVVKAVVEQATIEYPPDAVEVEVDDLQERQADRVQREQRMSLTDYLKLTGQTEEELREELRPQAEERLQRSLVLIEVVGQENLQVTAEEVAERIDEVSQVWGDQAAEVKKQLENEQSRRNIANDLLVTKVINRLVAIARGEAESDESEASEEDS